MDITLGRQSLGPSAAGPSEAGPRTDAERLKVAELAREFEASLLVQMVRQMRQSLLSEDEQEEGLGNETMTDTIDVELARQLAAQGGIGLGRIVEKAMEKLANGGAAELVGGGAEGGSRYVDLPTHRSPGTAEPALAVESNAGQRRARSAPPVTAGTPDLALPMSEPVNSRFGWRDDPFHGVRKFHAGLDFRAAYGREVPAAGAGRVVFAGERGAYGQMVVVDHGGGVETRYAHLSTVTATVGQELAQGDVVGRVGQTGRATGPHLHFELLMDGHRVDPMQVAGRLPAGLKNLTAGDD